MQNLTIVFDLDGTLVDTAPDLVATLNHVLEGAGLPPVGIEEIRPHIGFGARAMLNTCLIRAGAAAGDSRLDALMTTYLIHYHDNIAVKSRPFPGAVEALEDFRARGARLAVCTNKYEGLSKHLLKELAVDHLFGAVTGADSFEVRKPNPEHLTRTIALAGGSPAHAVMVGDSETDIRTARAAKVPVVGVTFGYSDKPMEGLGADALIGHYRELGSAIRRLLKG